MDEKTKMVHAGVARDPYTGAASIPIYRVSTFAQEDPVNLGPRDYGRSDNPTREALEKAVADLEGGVRGFAYGSGVAAIGSAILALFKSGDHIIAASDVYGGTYRMLTALFPQWGLSTTFVDMTDPQKVEDAIKPNTRGIFAETPSNPTMRITDLRAVAAIAKSKGLYSLIDNTFMTPYLQKPLALGFDVSIHSATKFLGGHSDLIAGVTAAKDGETAKHLKRVQNGLGAVLGPDDSWLVLRGIRTLAARMDAQQAGTEKIAKWLANHPSVINVNYPGLSAHPGREIHFSQATGAGAVLSFELKDRESAVRFMKGVTLPLVGVSLGGVETIVSYPATMSHAAMNPEERLERGISDGLIRLSVGLESAGDLIADFDRALKV